MADDLLAIELSGDEDRAAEGSPAQPKSRQDKNYQTEEAFQKVKSEYRPKIENGEIWKTIKLPLGHVVPKAEAQELLHAVEELYYFRRYAEAADFVRAVLADDPQGLGQDTRAMLVLYRGKCLEKAAGPGHSPTPAG